MKITPDDRWMVCAPVRSGGRFVVNLITQIYHKNNIEIKVVESDHGDKIEEIPLGHVYHTHYAGDYTTFRDAPNTKTIIITRDIIDSIISMMVAIHLDKYHIYSIEEMNSIKIEKIYVDPTKIYDHHHNFRTFYGSIQSTLNPSTIVISYDDILRGPENVADKIGLSKYLNTRILSEIVQYLPIKNTWNNMDWIDNSEEIKTIIAGLERRILQH